MCANVVKPRDSSGMGFSGEQSQVEKVASPKSKPLEVARSQRGELRAKGSQLAKEKSALKKVESCTLESFDHNEEEIQDYPIVFVYSPSESLLCDLHKGLLRQPLILTKCGHTFCKQCVLPVVQQQQKCPLNDAVDVKEKHLVVNRAVAGQIEDLLIYCRYGLKQDSKDPSKWVLNEQGCSERIRFGKRKEHDEKCLFAPAKCPYCDDPLVRRMNFENHVYNCTNVPCPHKIHGCKFHGTKAAQEEHLKTCSYEKLKDYIAQNQQQVSRLKERLMELENENNALHLKVQDVTNQMKEMAKVMESTASRYDLSIRYLTSSLEESQKLLQDVAAQLHNAPKSTPAKTTGVTFAEKVAGGLVEAKCTGTLSGHQGPVWCLAFTDTFLVSGSSDSTIKLWDLVTFKCRITLQGHSGIVHAVAAQGNIIVSGSSDETIKVWNIDSSRCVRTLTEHGNTVCALVIAAGRLFSGSYTEIKVWDLNTFCCIQTLVGHNHWVRAITISGNYLYSGAYNMIKVWDLNTFTNIKSIPVSGGSIYVLAVDGRFLLTGTYENSINVLDLESFESVAMLSGHLGAVYSLCVMGGRLFSGSYDTTIRVWTLGTWQLVQTLNRHLSSVDCMIAANGLMFSGSADNTIKIWK